MVFKLEHASESPEGCYNTVLGSTRRGSDSVGLECAREFVFLRASRYADAANWGPYFEKHWCCTFLFGLKEVAEECPWNRGSCLLGDGSDETDYSGKCKMEWGCWGNTGFAYQPLCLLSVLGVKEIHILIGGWEQAFLLCVMGGKLTLDFGNLIPRIFITSFKSSLNVPVLRRHFLTIVFEFEDFIPRKEGKAEATVKNINEVECCLQLRI